MLKFPIVKLLFDRRRLANDKKKGGFKIEVSYLDKRVRFSTEVRVLKAIYQRQRYKLAGSR